MKVITNPWSNVDVGLVKLLKANLSKFQVMDFGLKDKADREIEIIWGHHCEATRCPCWWKLNIWWAHFSPVYESSKAAKFSTGNFQIQDSENEEHCFQ